MYRGDYQLPEQYGVYIAESNKSNHWMNKDSSFTSPESDTLEDEILLLRSKMERLFLQEQSFTAEIVIEISSLLDLKINEFMKNRHHK